MSNKISCLSLVILCALPSAVFAGNLYQEGPGHPVTDGAALKENETVTVLPKMVVNAVRIEDPILLNAANLDASDLPPLRAATSDTATLVESLPGVTFYRGGGVSSLPVVHGMADDRIRINVDGREVPSACGNHMNPPLSNIDPADVSSMDVMAGITPVSSGGDSIAGTIAVQTTDPQFAKKGSGGLVKGNLSAFTRSNGQNNGGHVGVTMASENVGLMVQGSTTQANDYKDGDDQRVKSTAFEATTFSATLAAQGEGNLITLDIGGQNIPYQDFVNAHMDMIGNQTKFVNGRYEGQFAWGKLDTQLYWQDTDHQMNVRGDKLPGMDMPMNTEGTTAGYLLKAEIDLSQRDILRVGHEFIHFGLDDGWPASPAQAKSACNTGDVTTSTCSMAPGTLWSIRNGRRNRLGTFAEWNAQWSKPWSTLLGVRNDVVWMNTDDVIGYNMNPAATGSAAYQADAMAFNGRDRSRQDVNFDWTALLRFEPDPSGTYEGGYARKTRSPNLYERYLWVNRSSMSSRMNSAVGDANGYSGNMDLKPEVAHTVSFSADWHDPSRKNWNIKATPYYTRVEDFIDADRCSVLTGGNGCTSANLVATSGLVNLQYANHDAELYGMDLSGRSTLGTSALAGDFSLAAAVGYVRGKNLDTGDHLYHIMPLNARLALEQEKNRWSNTIEWQLVDRKDEISTVRNELKTSGYGLVNFRTSYQWFQARLDAGIENLLDQRHDSPLGGVYWIGDKTGNTPVPGPGRSVHIGMTVEF